jgi:uncharacterized protein YheU (UPF0270 family)
MDALPPDVLTRVIEDFVTRGGTDDGQVDTPLAERVAMVRSALHRREAVLLWDADSEQVMVVPRGRHAR